MSAINFMWKIATFFIVGGSSTATAFLASSTPFFKELGILSWVVVGITTGLLVSIIFYLVQSAADKSANARYVSLVSRPSSTINPLANSFEDSIIRVEDLRIPGIMVHENKLFKNCHFVGPGVLFFDGARFNVADFRDIGDVIPVPSGTLFTGMVSLKDCTFNNCFFHRVTFILCEDAAEQLVKQASGVNLAGKKMAS
ncbi:hypothetical protein SJR98_03060 [Aeromonas hydrophila]|uniref:hypothetical protein n=1 Tax=Aeromonas hydrophila TaxID=644 RepID=UPI0029DB4A19|nr:hypothetical protein [Aeromonas hydrophila]MDX7777055.1 hypothetical protein [Aeromonas hydrophila]